MHNALADWFAQRGWSPFDYQRECIESYRAGGSGFVHAPTGTGKTLAVWLGPIDEYLNESKFPRPTAPTKRESAEPIRVLWITPLRALAADTVESLIEPARDLNLPWTIEKRTGDTTASLKAKQRRQLPTALVTTPESLSLMLSYPDAQSLLSTLRCVIVDEWHELLSTKRGVQTELALARLRRWNPSLRTWGLSATLGNLEEARDVLLGSSHASKNAPIINGKLAKQIHIETVLPEDVQRFPWAGHLGTNLLNPVLAAIENAKSTLLFTNTRSQTEIWYRAIALSKPENIAQLALHHGSLDREVRERVEDRLRDGSLRCVVCTSSLDLGVDFTPVDQVIQVGSPKGIARLMQRAGRSGHQPGVTSRVLCIPAHAFELIEFAAARRAMLARTIETRSPLSKPLDVLTQHLVTVASGGGFETRQLYEEVRSTHTFRDLSMTEFRWALDFTVRGGAALGAYPQYHRLVRAHDSEQTGEERYTIASDKLARHHRLAIGTITSDLAMTVRSMSGKVFGSIEESFIARLAAGDRFVFAGKVLELVRVKDMTAFVRLATRRSGAVPRWQGGRTPLSTLLSEGVRTLLEEARLGTYTEPELECIRPILELQSRWSVIPAPDELLIEHTSTRHARHTFLFPFEGRHVHEGLGLLLAHRIARTRALSLSITVNDYGIELRSATPLDVSEDEWRSFLSTADLLPDLLACLNHSELARRRFRDIARIAGLIHPGYPGRTGKTNRHLQASSELFFDVFAEFDPANLLLDQARREVLEDQMEVSRLRNALEKITRSRITQITPPHLTPLGFPLWAESLRTQHVSSETWRDRIGRMVMQLERTADREQRSGRNPTSHPARKRTLHDRG